MDCLLLEKYEVPEDRITFFKNTYCVVGTQEGSILGCQIDIMVHEFYLNGDIMYTYKPVEPEILVGDSVEHICSIYVPKFLENK